MQLAGMNADFETVAGNLPYLNLQWQRKYYGPGGFTVQMPAKDCPKGLAYLCAKDRPEVGMVQKVTYKSRLKGRFVELSGFFLEKMLDDKVVYPTFYGCGNLESEILRMVDQYKGDIPRLVVDGPGGLGSYLAEDGMVHFGVWQGKDRTQSQNVNSYAVFSDAFANIGEVEISTDDSNYKNYAVVASRGDGDERITAIADGSGGTYQRQVWVESRNARFDAKKQSLEQYQTDLRADGFNTLATKYYVVENTRISLTAALNLTGGQGDFNLRMPRTAGGGHGLAYMADYDLGDLCDVVVPNAGIHIQARIIAVREVIKNNRHMIDLELGEAVLTRTEKARL